MLTFRCRRMAIYGTRLADLRLQSCAGRGTNSFSDGTWHANPKGNGQTQIFDIKILKILNDNVIMFLLDKQTDLLACVAFRPPPTEREGVFFDIRMS